MIRPLILTAAAFFALGVTAGAFAQSDPQFDQQPPRDAFGNPASPDQNNATPPSRLSIQPGTYVTVRVNQWLSSDRNQQGDAFFASLASPLVVNGVVVAQRGQTVAGRVSEAQKAGRI